MKILMILERDFPPDLRVENEIKSLINEQHEVVLACYSLKQEDEIVETDWNGCRVYKKKINKFIYKSSIGALKFNIYFNFWRKHIVSILEKESIDAIHVHDLPLAKIGSELKEKRSVKFVLDLHENWPAYLRVSKHANKTLGKILSNNEQWIKYEIEQCQKADNVIVVVDEAKERLSKLGIPEHKIEIVSNYPVLNDFDDLHRNSKKMHKTILFYAGGIAEHRGLQFVIGALPEIIKHTSNVELRIFGQGNYSKNLSELASKTGVQNYVRFFGQVPYKRVLDELMEADITLIPHSKNDHTDSTIPHKLFQYIYAGKPVLASNCAPIERIIKTANAGAVYEWNNSKDVVAKYIWIIENSRFFQQDKMKEVIRKNYNWENEVKKLQNIYMP